MVTRLTSILLQAALVVVASGAAAADSTDRTNDRPNVVVILADDFGYECVGANGGTSYKTPNLDRLAAEGARFEHCYTQPLCTPTRVQLMTGQLTVRNYVRFGLLDGGQKTIGHLLKDAGYATGVFGKWQLSHGFEGPAKFGFDDYRLWFLTRRPPRYANPGLEFDGREVDFSQGEYGPDLIQQAALEFIDRNREQPFLLYYPMTLTHSPFQPTPNDSHWDPTAIGEQVNQDPKNFASMVSHLDGLVGQLVEKLEQHKLREKTLFIFVGDNGTAVAINSEWNGRSVQGGKGKTTDAGMRVPLIVNWPGQVIPGTVVKDLVDTTDILPTIAEATAAQPPKDVVLDGRSFLPQTRGESGEPREWLYAWYSPNQGNRINVPVELARTHRFKLYGDGRLFELDGRYGEVELDLTSLSSEALAARELLQGAISQFANARPEALRKAPTQ